MKTYWLWRNKKNPIQKNNFVVMAASEEAARQKAYENADSGFNSGRTDWLYSEHTDCLDITGDESVVIGF